MADSYSNVEKMKKIQNEVDVVKDVMSENIEKILKRGEKVEVLLDKSSQLSHESTIFRRKSSELKRKQLYKNIKIGVIIFLIISLIVVIIIISSN